MITMLFSSIFRDFSEGFAPRQDSSECQEMCNDMGRHLEQCAHPVFWNLTPK